MKATYDKALRFSVIPVTLAASLIVVAIERHVGVRRGSLLELLMFLPVMLAIFLIPWLIRQGIGRIDSEASERR